jgi:prophage regulatory protein
MSVFQNENEDRFLTIKEVCEKLSVSRTKIYNMIRSNEFPAGIQLGERCTRWRLSAVVNWMQERTSAQAA